MAMDQTFHFQTWKSECIIVLQSLTEWSYTDGWTCRFKTYVSSPEDSQHEVSLDAQQRM